MTDITWEDEVVICHDKLKCKNFHPEIGCICEYENQPHPKDCGFEKELLKIKGGKNGKDRPLQKQQKKKS